MSRNIDIAIKQFKEIATDNRNEQHYWENRPNPNAGTLEYAQKACESAEYHEYIVACLEELKTRREADRWIPVSERLPEYSDNYLVFVDDGFIDIGVYHSDKEEWSLCDAYGFYWAKDKGVGVIAWKPLPKPYESEGE